jgi:hypothetical protein
MQTHIEVLPTVNTLRLCNRFGHGRFTDFPVELIKMIEGYLIKPIREKVAQDLAAASRCFENDCSLIDHVDRETLLDMYHQTLDEFHMTHPPRELPRKPNDEQLICLRREYYEMGFEAATEEYTAHHRKRALWPTISENIFSKANQAMFLERFGLDMWVSFVRLPDEGIYRGKDDFGDPQATVTYLTLPGSVARQHKWDGNTHYDGIHAPFDAMRLSYGENGFGMAVEVCRQPPAEELSSFTKALKSLKLDVFVHPSQMHSPALGLGFSDERGDSDAPEPQRSEGADASVGRNDSTGTDNPNGDDKTSKHSFPRLMLLTRSRDGCKN